MFGVADFDVYLTPQTVAMLAATVLKSLLPDWAGGAVVTGHSPYPALWVSCCRHLSFLDPITEVRCQLVLCSIVSALVSTADFYQRQ